MSEFTVPSVSLAGAPTIDWTFDGAIARAECAGATAYAEATDEWRAELRIIDATGAVIADVMVRKMPADESITTSLMAVGSALLWSYFRWCEASKKDGATPDAEPLPKEG